RTAAAQHVLLAACRRVFGRGVIAAVSSLAALLLALTPLPLGAQPSADEPSWAVPGPYIAPNFTDFTLTSFRSDQPVIATYFFYWFDAPTLRASGEHFPFNPVDDQTQSFLDSNWYAKQFADMLD